MYRHNSSIISDSDSGSDKEVAQLALGTPSCTPVPSPNRGGTNPSEETLDLEYDMLRALGKVRFFPIDNQRPPQTRPSAIPFDSKGPDAAQQLSEDPMRTPVKPNIRKRPDPFSTPEAATPPSPHTPPGAPTRPTQKEDCPPPPVRRRLQF